MTLLPLCLLTLFNTATAHPLWTFQRLSVVIMVLEVILLLILLQPRLVKLMPEWVVKHITPVRLVYTLAVQSVLILETYFLSIYLASRPSVDVDTL